ncbi:MAG: hypothetical protein QOE68_4721, partial [Thermoanaerobaculia bacterium]|nr:hypothetical protein [Thermoanaerobaculia bacterium]
ISENAPPAAPESVPRLRLLILYADPAGNIAELPTHIAALNNFVAANDEMLEVKVLEFRTAKNVRQDSTGFDPHIVYYIGHGSQSGTEQAHLLVDYGTGIDITAFAALLHQLGAPRVVILNACESFAGSALDPYLGAALRLSPQFDFVVAMQMKEPIPAATNFAAAVLAVIARGDGLAAAMAAGRTAMAAVAESDFEVTPYIPVLMQRTRQDVPFSVDAGEYERVRLRNLMASRLELIDQMPRVQDAEIRRVLTGGGKHHVSFLTGPRECGKSTAVRGVLNSLLNDDEIRERKRYLYFSVKHLPPTQNLANDVAHVLETFARDCGAFTRLLLTSLSEATKANPDASPLSTLATWLELRARSGYQFVVVLDDLDPAVAAEIATRAGLIKAGHLMVITDANRLQDGSLVERLTLDPMTNQEVTDASPEWDEERVRQVVAETGGMPRLVAAAKRAKTVGANLLPPPGTDERDALHLVAMSDLPLPAEVAAILGLDDAVLKGSVAAGFVSHATDGALTLPPPIREDLLGSLTVDQDVELRRKLASAYEAVAYSEQTGGFRRARVVSLYREALRQRVLILESSDADPSAEETLEDARDDLFELDYQLLEEGDEPAEAIVLWNLFRKAAAPFDDDRETDARYARLLQRRGSIAEADDILRQWTKSGPADVLQIRILLAHDEVLHDLGRDPKERLELIERARATFETLQSMGAVKKRELAEFEAMIEQAYGNALGYGEDAKPEEAVQHLDRAVWIFESVRDYRAESAYSDKIEVARYNGILRDNDRAEAIDRIRRGTDALVARSVQLDAINRFYELGRLASDPAERAKWFHAAYERAGDGYSPIRWHAAIHWKCAVVDAKQRTLAEVTPEILTLCDELKAWNENAWSRRVLRDALHFLAKRHGDAGAVEQQRQFLLQCREVITLIERNRERRGDAAVRAAVDEAILSLPPREQSEGGHS